MTNDYGNLELHTVLLDALKDIDRVCRENGLRYYLHAGTLLGAINHQGFIPWDDDVDITMFPYDYAIFQNAILSSFPGKYFIETFRNTDSHKSNIISLRIVGYDIQHINGTKHPLSIDLSLLYNVPDSKFRRKVQEKTIYFIDKMVYIKYGDIIPQSLSTKVLALFARLFSRQYLGEMMEKVMRWEKKKTENVGILYYTDPNPYTKRSGYDNDIMRRQWYEPPMDIPYEDTVLMTISEPEKDLIHRYGEDYAKPYPEEKRVAKHGVWKIVRS